MWVIFVMGNSSTFAAVFRRANAQSPASARPTRPSCFCPVIQQTRRGTNVNVLVRGEKKVAGTPENVFEITGKAKIGLLELHWLQFF